MKPNRTIGEDTSEMHWYRVSIGKNVRYELQATDSYDAERRARIMYRKDTGLEPENTYASSFRPVELKKVTK